MTLPQADRALSNNGVVAKLKTLVSEFKGTLPVVVNLRCAALKRRHWNAIHSLVGYEIKARRAVCCRGRASVRVSSLVGGHVCGGVCRVWRASRSASSCRSR